MIVKKLINFQQVFDIDISIEDMQRTLSMMANSPRGCLPVLGVFLNEIMRLLPDDIIRGLRPEQRKLVFDDLLAQANRFRDKE